MLTSPALLVLGLVAERAANPYRLIGLLARLHAESWCPIAESSVYAIVRSLERRGLVEGRDDREGRLPSKRVYEATVAGRELLEKEVLEIVASRNRDFSAFDVALLLACHAPRKDFLAALKDRAAYWGKAARAVGLRLAELEEETPRTAALALVRHSLRLAEAEEGACLDILAAVEADSTWNSFPALASDGREEP